MKVALESTALYASAYQKIEQRFSRAASEYEKAAKLQREVGHALLDALQENIYSGERNPPQRIIDLGCGTGYFSHALQQLFPEAELMSLDISSAMLEQAAHKNSSDLVRADMECLPFSANSVDLVWANMSLQWSVHLSESFKEIRRVLKPGGFCFFSLPGPLSLMELKRSWKAVDEAAHVNEFPHPLWLQQYLSALHFQDIALHSQSYPLEYNNLVELMRHLKEIGANTVLHARKTLMGKQRLKRCMEAYEHYRKPNGLLPCSYDIVFVRMML